MAAAAAAVLVTQIPADAQQPASVAAPAAPAPAPAARQEARRITAAELKPLVEKGEAVLLDVRSDAAWRNGHAEGALHVPLNDVASRLAQLPKEKLIAAYCT